MHRRPKGPEATVRLDRYGHRSFRRTSVAGAQHLLVVCAYE